MHGRAEAKTQAPHFQYTNPRPKKRHGRHNSAGTNSWARRATLRSLHALGGANDHRPDEAVRVKVSCMQNSDAYIQLAASRAKQSHLPVSGRTCHEGALPIAFLNVRPSML